MLQRNEVSTFLPYRRPSLSRITVPNQPNSMMSRITKPAPSTGSPRANYSVHAADSINASVNNASATDQRPVRRGGYEIFATAGSWRSTHRELAR